MSIISDICFYLSKKRVLSRSSGNAGETPSTFDSKSYRAWRASELSSQFIRNFDVSDLEGRDVLDFGCGEGDLSFFVANSAVKSIISIDLDKNRIESAVSRLQELNLTVRPKFIHASNPHDIDLPDSSVDIILCFDVLEHILDYRNIIYEWRRILRKNGKVFIWWIPWLHPYGHHIESLVPLPWAHVFFPEKVLIRTCTRIYDMPEFKPRLWDLDKNGNKKPNKWLNLNHLPDVNRLTISRFEKICRMTGFDIEERMVNGFKGLFVARLTNIFTHIPFMRGFFCSNVVYKLQKQN